MTTQHSLLDSPQKVTKIQCADCSEKISLKGLEYFSVQECGNCGTSFEVPRQIEHYLLESILSDNGVIAQYRALDLLLNRYVILKKLNKHFYSNTSPDFPFVESNGAVNIYSSIVYDDELYLVLEHIKGRSIKSYLRKKNVDQKKAVSIAISICEIFIEAAETGVSHGHLNPGSIWVDENGHVRIADFMLCQNILNCGGSPEKISKVLDVRYCSASRLRKLEVNQKSDVYSLGVCLYEMLTGETPYNSTTMDSIVAERELNEPDSAKLEKAGVDTGLTKLIISILNNSEEFETFEAVLNYIKNTFIVSKPKTSSKSSKKVVAKTKTGSKTKKKKAPVKLPVRDKNSALNSRRKLKKLFK